MHRSCSARSSHVAAPSGLPVWRSVIRFGVSCQRTRPSGVNGILPSAGSTTSEVLNARGTRPFPDSSQISLNSPLVGTSAAKFLSVVASAAFSSASASSLVRWGFLASAAGRSSGMGVWFDQTP